MHCAGKANDCSAPRFRLEDNLDPRLIPVLIDPSEESNDILEVENPKPGCSRSSTSKAEMNTLTHDRAENIVASKFKSKSAENKPIIATESEADMVANDNALKRKFEQYNEEAPINEWEDQSFFDKEWLELMKMYQNDIAPVDTINRPEIRTWFEYLFDQTNPTESRYRCRLCHKYSDQFSLGAQYNSRMREKDGREFVRGTKEPKRKNRNHINAHSKSPSHQRLIEWLRSRARSVDVSKRYKTSEEKLNAKECEIYGVTSNMFKLVYTEVMLNYPLFNHRPLVDTFESMGAYLGVKHYERTSAQRIADFISSQMHKKLLDHVKTTNSPWAIITDGSTDASANHYLVVLLVGLEEDLPKVYLYRLLKLGVAEDAQALTDTLTNAFEQDGIDQQMKKHLVSFTSDGASVMLGRKNGMGQKLSKYLGHKLHEQHCLAHRLQLAIKRAFGKSNKLKFFFHMESFLNGLYVFYFSKGHKRRAHLDQTCRAMAEDRSILNLNHIFEVRWVSSELSAIKKILDGNSYEKLFLDLNSIQDENFEDKTKASALGFATQMKNKDLIMILHFLADILSALSTSSIRLQKRYGTLMDQVSNLIDLKAQIALLKNRDGPYIKQMLQKSLCGASKCSTVLDFEENPATKFVGIDVIRLDKRKIKKTKGEGERLVYPKLSDVRDIMIEKLLAELENYMPDTEAAHFQVLDPKQWPDASSGDFAFGNNELSAIFNGFGHKNSVNEDGFDDDSDQDGTDFDYRNKESKFKSEFKEMIYHIRQTRDWTRLREENIIYFWHHYMQKSLVPQSVSDIVRKVLVTPIGSADAERAFSTLFHIRSKRRARLSAEHLESYLRIRMNGPKDIRQFASLNYAKQWVLNGGKMTDSKKDDNGQKHLPRPEPPTQEENEDGSEVIKQKLLDRSKLF